MLNEQQIKNFQRDGFLVIENFASHKSCDTLLSRTGELIAEFEPVALHGQAPMPNNGRKLLLRKLLALNAKSQASRILGQRFPLARIYHLQNDILRALSQTTTR